MNGTDTQTTRPGLVSMIPGLYTISGLTLWLFCFEIEINNFS